MEYVAQPPIAAPRVELQGFLRRVFLLRIFGRAR